MDDLMMMGTMKGGYGASLETETWETRFAGPSLEEASGGPHLVLTDREGT